MSDYCYFARVLSETTILPIEICDHIFSFSDDEVPIAATKDNAPVGWFFFSLEFKPIRDVMHEDEIDCCKKCKGWATGCSCEER
jgi:hypothetical protein